MCASPRRRRPGEYATRQAGSPTLSSKLTFSRFLGRTITVSVEDGTGVKSFDIHEDLIVEHSGFFKDAINQGDWQSGERPTIELDIAKTGLEAFEVFARFLYTGSIFTAKERDPDDAFEDGESGDEEYVLIFRCWLVGETLVSTTFKDAVTDALISKIVCSDWHPTGLDEHFYPASKDTSTIRKLLIDIARWYWKEEDHVEFLKRKADRLDFYDALLLAYRDAFAAGKSGGPGKSAPFEEEDVCVYHEHVAEGTPCYKTMF